MLIVHEGIPGSGKTFEAVSKHLVVGLKKKRHCFCRIDELNFAQLAQLAEITEEECRSLLVQLTVEQAMVIQTVEMPIGSLVLLDEVQNYFPDDRKKLPDDVVKFVAEHRHKGLDIILMCQDLRDVHKIWRRRVDTKIVFTKLDMLGGKGYRWKLYKAIAPEKFKEVSAGEEKYAKEIFGSYKSFEAGAEAAQKYDDKRRTIWASKFFRYGLPMALLVGGYAIYWLIHAFTGGGLAKSLGGAPTAAGSGKTPAAVSAPAAPVGAAAPVAAPAPEKKYQKDFISDLSERYRLRVSALMRSKGKLTAVFEWYDDALHVRERMNMLTVAKMGYLVTIDDSMEFATIQKGEFIYYATQFPIEVEMKISDRKQQEIAGGAPVAGGVAGQQTAVIPYEKPVSKLAPASKTSS